MALFTKDLQTLPKTIKTLDKKGFTPFQILKDSLLAMCKLRSKDFGRLIDSHKKFGTGFTFTEVIIAALIVAILSAGVFSAFWGTQYFLNRARHRIQAFNFAREALDKMRSDVNYQYKDPAMDVIPPTHTEAGIIVGDVASLGGTLTYGVEEPIVNGYKQVTIEVKWNEPTFKK